jgi:hypothetical protein
LHFGWFTLGRDTSLCTPIQWNVCDDPAAVHRRGSGKTRKASTIVIPGPDLDKASTGVTWSSFKASIEGVSKIRVR